MQSGNQSLHISKAQLRPQPRFHCWCTQQMQVAAKQRWRLIPWLYALCGAMCQLLPQVLLSQLQNKHICIPDVLCGLAASMHNRTLQRSSHCLRTMQYSMMLCFQHT
jgi:hypothetical protein